MTTYDVAVGAAGPEQALELYRWNAQASAALLAPMHICEVVMRNAVSDAIEHQYGERWPWSDSFGRSLPNPTSRTVFNPRADLIRARRLMTSTGKVIPELKFIFWQSMFTSRHDRRIWTPSLRRVLPASDSGRSVSTLRNQLYQDFEQLRLFRNRIAHHEPIFNRDLAEDLATMLRLVSMRSLAAESWMQSLDTSQEIIAHRP